MLRATMLPAAIVAVTLGLLPLSCGGSGGGDAPPLRQPPRLLIGDADVPQGATSGTLDLGLAAEAVPPTMLQLDLVTDPARLRWRTDVEQIADVSDLRAGVVEPGRLRLVFGDARSKSNPRVLPIGALLRIRFDVVPGATAGEVAIHIEAVVASDAVGDAAEMAESPVAGTVTLR